MARILLQTTIPYAEDDLHVGRFALLRDELVAAGHTVTARNREPDAAGNDPVLSSLGTSAFDQLWLMGVDTGDGLCGADIEGINAFRARGGGVLTARDHADLGRAFAIWEPSAPSIIFINTIRKTNRNAASKTIKTIPTFPGQTIIPAQTAITSTSR